MGNSTSKKLSVKELWKNTQSKVNLYSYIVNKDLIILKRHKPIMNSSNASVLLSRQKQLDLSRDQLTDLISTWNSLSNDSQLFVSQIFLRDLEGAYKAYKGYYDQYIHTGTKEENHY